MALFAPESLTRQIHDHEALLRFFEIAAEVLSDLGAAKAA